MDRRTGCTVYRVSYVDGRLALSPLPRNYGSSTTWMLDTRATRTMTLRRKADPIMSRTYKTAPYRVRKTREPGIGKWYSWCGNGCHYCGMGRKRRRWDHHATRNRVRRDLNRGIRCEAYTEDVHPMWVRVRYGY